MKRRAFIVGLAGAAALSPQAYAQQSSKVWLIGFLGPAPAFASVPRVEALRTGLRELGYVEGKNAVIEFRWADGAAQMRELAAELVRLNADVIFATSSTEVEAARQVTRTIPIVFATHADPVGVGHVASLPRPGGNATGLSVVQTDLTTKALEVLREAVPHAARIGILFSSAAPSSGPTLQAAESAAARLKLMLQPIPLQGVADFEEALEQLARGGADAVFVAASSLTVRSAPALLAELALKQRLPTMFGSRDNVAAGGLMSYAPDQHELTRRAAIYIDKILRGAKPSEIPVEQASTYQLVINLRTATALGLTIPPSLLARADEVIE
jgi:putative ABC transport system substrate-binding protein